MSSDAERYRSILDASLDAVISVDAQGRVVDWNVRAAMMFGRRPEQIVGKPAAAELLVGDDVDRLAQALDRYQRNPSDSTIGKRMAMRGRDHRGREFPIELTVTPIDAAGAMHFAIFIRDYSSRDNATQRREQQNLETQLLQHATLRVAQSESFDDAIRISLKVMCDITGWPIGHAWVPDSQGEHLVTKGVWHGIDEQKNRRFIEAMRDYRFARGEGLPGLIWQRGEALWIRDLHRDEDFIRRTLGKQLGVRGVFGFPVTADGDVEAVLEFFSHEELAPEPELLLLVGSISNELGRILERRRWDEERARLAAIVDTSSDAIIGKSFDGTIVSWNEGAAQMYGYTADEAIGRTAAIILPAGVTEEEPEIRAAVRAGQRLVQFETRRHNKAGEILDVSLTISPIMDAEGRIVGSATIERDMTRRKQHERELVRARKDAVASLRAKNEFLANISHELRTPMNAIIGMVELALGEDHSTLTRDYLLTARDSSRVMLSLVNDLLDFSRIEAGKLELDVEPFSLRRVFDEAIRALSLRAHERGLELTGQVNANVPDRLEGDGRRLRQVIMNLAGNAIKFTEQGEVTIRVAVDDRRDDAATLRFTVEDTGIGISADDQQRIFKPFMQVDASSTRKQTGTGLGLAICRELIERMGGEINVTSELGQGSRFEFSVQMRVLASQPGDAPPQVRQLRDLPVLIVDDNATNRRILRETMSNWSLDPQTANSAGEALRKVREARERRNPFALLVIDALMPETDGFELIESLEDEDASTILMLSSADRQTFEERCEQLDIDAFVEKPVSESMLLDAIMTALGGPQTDRSEVQRIEAASRTLHVLVVEDMPANQKVVRAILHKRGHDVTIAHNGREAVDCHLRDNFDVILMDVQMPTMDGYQASRAIRELDDEDKAAIPIIAMTAHALASDRLQCHEAGMDSYLPKPVDAQELIRVVEQFAAAARANRSRSPGAPSEARAAKTAIANRHQQGATVISLEGPLQRLGGDRALLRDLATFLLEDAPSLLSAVGMAARDGDFAATKRAAHSLKGLAANFDADHAQRTAMRVEDAAQRGDLDEIKNHVPVLNQAFDDVFTAVKQEILNTPAS